MEDQLKITLKHVRSTPNFLCFENPDLDDCWRTGSTAIKVWLPKTMVEPRGYVPPTIDVTIRETPRSLEQSVEVTPIDDDDVPF